MPQLRIISVVSIVIIGTLTQVRAETPSTMSAPGTSSEAVIGIDAGILPSDSHKTGNARISGMPAGAAMIGIQWPDGSNVESWSFVPQGEKSKFTFKGAVDSANPTSFVLSGKSERDFGMIKLATVTLNSANSSLDITWEDGGDRAMLAYRVLAECQWLLSDANGKVVGRLAVTPEETKIVEVSVGRSAAKSDDPVRVAIKGIPKGGRGVRIDSPKTDAVSGWNTIVEPLAAEGRVGYTVKLQHRTYGALQLDVTFSENNAIELALSRSDALAKLEKIAVAEVKKSSSESGIQDDRLRGQIATLDQSIHYTQDRIRSYEDLISKNSSSYYKDRLSALKESLKTETLQNDQLKANLLAMNSEPDLDPLTPLVLEIEFPLTQQKTEKLAILKVMLVNRPGDRRQKSVGQPSEQKANSTVAIKNPNANDLPGVHSMVPAANEIVTAKLGPAYPMTFTFYGDGRAFKKSDDGHTSGWGTWSAKNGELAIAWADKVIDTFQLAGGEKELKGKSTNGGVAITLTVVEKKLSPAAANQLSTPQQNDKDSTPAASPAAVGERIKEITIPATTGHGSTAISLGALKKGQSLMFQYVRGEWTAWPGDPAGSPDDEIPKNKNVLRVSICEKQGKTAVKIADIPGNTKARPFAFVADHDIDEVVLNMDDKSPDNNAGEVVYRVWQKKE